MGGPGQPTSWFIATGVGRAARNRSYFINMKRPCFLTHITCSYRRCLISPVSGVARARPVVHHPGKAAGGSGKRAGATAPFPIIYYTCYPQKLRIPCSLVVIGAYIRAVFQQNDVINAFRMKKIRRSGSALRNRGRCLLGGACNLFKGLHGFLRAKKPIFNNFFLYKEFFI